MSTLVDVSSVTGAMTTTSTSLDDLLRRMSEHRHKQLALLRRLRS
jgi:hypothetical protein